MTSSSSTEESDAPGPAPADLRSLVWVPDPQGSLIEAVDHEPTHQSIRLFWDDPPWRYAEPEVADHWAHAVASSGIAVAAMRCEVESVGPGSRPSRWIADSRLPRILPYRNERFGIQAGDFERVDYIDVRLTRYTDRNGRRAYPADYLARMGIETAAPWVPSMTLPPEITSVDQLSRTVDSLRNLAPDHVRILASVSITTLAQELPPMISLGFDGFILRGDSEAFSGLPIAAVVSQVRGQLDAAGQPSTSLWVVPPPVSADDAAKLVVLGADAVACDAWCDPFLWTPPESGSSFAPPDDWYLEKAGAELGHQVDRVDGLVHSAMHRRSQWALASTDASVSRSLGIPLVAAGRRSSKTGG